MKDVRLTLVGFGKIGRAFSQTLVQKKQHLNSLGYNIRVVAICEQQGCIVDEAGIDLGGVFDGGISFGQRKTLEVINSVGSDIVVEMTPGNIQTGEPGLGFMKAALNSGKHVVTSNKSPLSLAFSELSGLSLKNGVKLKFEATVGGAIPIINTCTNELKGNTILNIYGILNGTTNYILSKMGEEGIDFKVALKEAQNLGFAEPDPSYDLKGVDSAAKVVILANSIFGMDIRISDLKVSGIEGITSETVELASEYGFAIKLVGDVKNREVSPRLVALDHPLNVPGNLNAVLVQTDTAGDISLIGAGAGPKETSSAILGDVLSIADLL